MTQQYDQQAPPPGAYYYPPQGQPMAPPQKGSGLAITALVLGIIAVVLCWIPVINIVAIILGIIGAVFGIIGIFKSKRVMSIIGAGLSLVAIIGSIVVMATFVDAVDEAVQDMNASLTVPTPTEENAVLDAGAPASESAQAPAANGGLTMDQDNALGSASDYLDVSAFSRSGLIEQLEFEGYSTADATMAVDAVGADWTEQAFLAAQQYLQVSNFSQSALVDQLEYDGFTAEQAKAGVFQLGDAGVK
jgi:hypothetical protein